jgi:hypothetical protein
MRLDRDRGGLVSDPGSLGSHAELAALLTSLHRSNVRDLCADHGWQPPEVVDELVRREVSATWVWRTGIGDMLDLAVDEQ